MATRFELVLHGDDRVRLRSAGEEALTEIERVEAQLSLYQPTSEITHLNARAAREAVRVTPPLFALLEHAQRLSAETRGAFDITVAPLVRCWGFMGEGGRVPAADELAAARACVGMHLVELNAADCTVRFAREGVMLDLGALGKGYAVECAIAVLREAGVTSALLHGGTSTACAIGSPPDTSGWYIAIDEPRPDASRPAKTLATIPLCDHALSVSAVWGKSFQSGTTTFGHVMDPRTGQPVSIACLTAVALPSATETDALSTALLALGHGGHDLIAGLRPGLSTLVLAGDRDGRQIAETRGSLFKLAESLKT